MIIVRVKLWALWRRPDWPMQRYIFFIHQEASCSLANRVKDINAIVRAHSYGFYPFVRATSMWVCVVGLVV